VGVSSGVALAGASFIVLCWARPDPFSPRAAPKDLRVPALMQELGELKAEVRALSARGEYMNDADGLFSGEGQVLKEPTFTLGWRPEDGFPLMGELRRDWSNKPFFYSDALGVLLRDQPTIGFGAVW
jgi:hypothetical protein